MEIRLDGKTLLVGVALGVIIAVVLGADGRTRVPTGERAAVLSAEATDFGMSVNDGGMVVVRNQNGDFFVVNPRSGMAMRVLRSRRLTEEPDRGGRDNRARPFNYSVAGEAEEATP